jgi:CheY-like chemotaxis protein
MSQPLALIVEDDPAQIEIFTKALQTAGYEVHTAVDGQVAIEQLGQLLPDLILLDLHLPFIDGEKVLARIKQDERLNKTRILIASADGSFAAYLRKQVDMVLEKPVSYHQLRLLAERLRPIT